MNAWSHPSFFYSIISLFTIFFPSTPPNKRGKCPLEKAPYHPLQE